MTLSDQAQATIDRLGAQESPSNADLKLEILALAGVLKQFVENSSLLREQLISEFASLAWRVSDLEKKKS